MAMRQRPKQASYVQKMEQQIPVPNRNVRQVTATAAPVKQQAGDGAGKGKKPSGAATEVEGGKMIRYMNLDDIPDGLAVSPPKNNQNSRNSMCIPLNTCFSRDLI